MRRTLARLTLASVLLGSACDRDPTFITTPDRPGVRYAWVFAGGSITIKEDPFVGELALICPSGSAADNSEDGTYSILLRLEQKGEHSATESCRLDLGKPTILSRAVDLPIALRPDSVKQVAFNVIVPPDTPQRATLDLPLVSVTAGPGHSCAVSARGVVYCWGSNESGQLGIGSHVSTLHPARVAFGQLARAAVAGGYLRENFGNPYTDDSFNCFLHLDGRTFCWGSNSYGATGGGFMDKRTPVELMDVPAFAELKAGTSSACGRTASGDLYCWGNFGMGWAPEPKRMDVASVVDFDLGENHMCAVTSAGRSHCWGSNEWRQFGDTTAAAHAFEQIAVGGSFTCALDRDGAAWCWGRNDAGQLGRDRIDPVCRNPSGYERPCADADASPRPVATTVRFRAIDAGDSHTCAIALAGTLYCWGVGTDGQLGHGTWENRRVPTPVLPELSLRFTSASAGERHSCAVATDGKAYCWGFNAFGQLGFGTTDNKALPIAVWGQQ